MRSSAQSDEAKRHTPVSVAARRVVPGQSIKVKIYAQPSVQAASQAASQADNLAPGALASWPAGAGWVRHYGGAGGDEAAAVAIAPNGDVVIAGQFSGAMDMDSVPMRSAGRSDAFVARLSPTGEVIWARSVGGSGQDQATGVAVDARGNILVVGVFGRRMRLAGGLLEARGNDDIFIASYTPEGSARWARRVGSPSWELVESVAVDTSGDIAIAGTFAGTLDSGSEVTLTSAGDADAFVLRLAADGSHIASARVGDRGWDEAGDVAFDPGGDIVFAGTQSVPGAGTYIPHGFVARYGVSGEPMWLRQLTETGGDIAAAVAVAETGEIVVAGSFSGHATMGDIALSSVGEQDVFVGVLEGNGIQRWVRHFGGKDPDGARAVTVVPGRQEIVIAGAISGDVSLGGETLRAGQRDMFLARYTLAGEHVWSRSFSGVGAGTRAVAVVPGGMVVMVGSFPHTLDAPGEPLVSVGGLDAFVLALPPWEQ